MCVCTFISCFQYLKFVKLNQKKKHYMLDPVVKCGFPKNDNQSTVYR